MPGAFETLKAAVDTPSWNESIRSGVFIGLGELGDVRGVDLLVSWLTDASKPMDARAAAAAGLRVLAGTRRIDPGPVQTRIVEALIAALEDPWETVVANAVSALSLWGDARALPPLRRLLGQTVDERVVRGTREAIRLLERGETREQETRQLRNDVDELREQNRHLREEMQRLEVQLTSRPE